MNEPGPGRRYAPMTIRARVAVATFLALAAIFLLAGLVIDRFDDHAALTAVDARLAGEAEALAAAVHYDGNGLEFGFEDETLTSFAKPRCGAYFQVFTSRGILKRSRSLDGRSLPDPAVEDLAAVEPDRPPRRTSAIIPGPFEPAVRLLTIAVRRGPKRSQSHEGPVAAPVASSDLTVFVQVARSMIEIEKALRGERLAVASGFTLALLLGTLAAFFIARRVTGPIRALTEDARSIASDGGQARLEISAVEGELSELASLLNQGFDRLASTLAREKRFAADAAHELRTPMTVCRARLEHALSRDRTPQEYRAAIQSALDASIRLEKLVEGLFLLSRADRSLGSDATVDLKALVLATLERLHGSSDEEAVRLHLPPQPAFVNGHEDLLGSLLGGLVMNARRHGASPRGVDVVLNILGDHAEILVMDRGPGFSPDLLNRIFERFARADASRSRATGGSGLGLAIAKAIVDAHHGTITVGPREGGGACVRVTLPLAARPRAVPSRRSEPQPVKRQG